MILDQIVETTWAAIAERKASCPESLLRERMQDAPTPINVLARLRDPGVSIIAEVKRASPSRGALNLSLEPAALALDYARAGADAISVLTEGAHFRGSLEDLSAARRGLREAGIVCPLLRKDFVVDAYQLLEARAHGADLVLLIAAILDDEALAHLYEEASCLGLTPLVEIHDERELRRAMWLHPAVVGINNRNLRDLTVDLGVTRRLRPLLPDSCLIVSESGIHTPAQVRELAQMQVHAALVGEALVTAQDPAAMLCALRKAGR